MHKHLNNKLGSNLTELQLNSPVGLQVRYGFDGVAHEQAFELQLGFQSDRI